MPQLITPPNTITQTNHGLVIKAGGRVIGAINEWSPREARQVTAVYQFGDDVELGVGVNAGGPGEPFEQVPGNINGQQIDVQRYDLFKSQMELAFGTARLDSLSRQDQPLTIQEFWNTPNPDDVPPYALVYQGCWFNQLGRTHRTTDDRIVQVRASFVFTRRTRQPT